MSDLLPDLSSMSQEERLLFLKKLELKKVQLESARNSRDSFGNFVKNIWPDFIEGRHHKIIAKKLEAIRDKKINWLTLLSVPVPVHSGRERPHPILNILLLSKNLLVHENFFLPA